ncbi:hypothetical protein [Variovorax sp. DAIF25]|uniref:hypothetical protein n=1 Tax=Variovorax sp. DAIF25 TaxID=3080983 RepID=UPI003D6AE4E5
MQKYQNNVTDLAGDAVVGLAVTIRNSVDGTVASIYSDNSGTVAPNPLTTDSVGYFAFYAADGRYDIAITGSDGYTDVVIADGVELGLTAAKKTELAASTGAMLIGTSGGQTAQQRFNFLDSFAATFGGGVRLKPNAVLIGSDPNYAAVAVNFTRTTIDRHAFEDWSILNTTDTNLGYCGFDAKATMNNSLQQNHFVGYQSRNVYNGSANLTAYFHGYDTAMVHNGTGTIAFAAGIHLRDVGGTGTITANYGIYIDAIARGSTKYAIYSAGGDWYCTDRLRIQKILSNTSALGIGFGVDVLNKSIAYGFGTGGQTNFGRHDFYDGKNGLVLRINENGAELAGVLRSTTTSFGLNYGVDVVGKTINIGFGTGGQTQFGTVDIYDGKNGRVVRVANTGVTVTGTGSFSGKVSLGSFTVVGLPAATDGDIAYCSNGRKVSEGAGAGTGVPVYYQAGWRRYSDDTIVLA